MLLALATADAYGAGFQYVKTSFIHKFNTGESYIQHPTGEINPGNYTGHTQMSLAIAEALVAGDEWTHLNLARRFLEAFHRDPRKSYGKRYYNLLRKVDSEKTFLEKINPSNDNNGSVVRAAPIGALSDIGEVMEKSAIQAMITHYSSGGIKAAVAAALMTHYFIYRLGDKAKLGSFLIDCLHGDWDMPWAGAVGLKGTMAVRAAITAIVRNDSMKELLVDCVSYTGQINTVAAIACAAASHCTQIRQDLPDAFIDELENDSYGKDYIIKLNNKLLALSK